MKTKMTAQVILQDKYDLVSGYVTFRERFTTLAEAERFVKEWNDNNKTHYCGVQIVKLIAEPLDQ